MKILHIATRKYEGGAECNDALLIEEGTARGHTIDKASESDYRGRGDYDLYIVCNTIDFDMEDLWDFLKDKKYILHEHGYRFCNMWANACCSVNCNRDMECEGGSYHRMTEKMVFNSKVNIVQSKLHLERYKKVYTDYLAEIVPSAIDDNIFKVITSKEKRSDTLFTVSGMKIHKGKYNLLRYIRKNNLETMDVYGPHDLTNQEIKEYNLNIKGIVYPFNKMVHVYNSYKTMIAMPVYYDPCQRTAKEAILCGCDVLYNDRMGCFINMPSVIQQQEEKPTKRFWFIVEGYV